MKLYEIAVGEPIQITVTVGKSTYEHMTIIELCKGGVIFVEPIRYEGKILNFTGDQVEISIMYISNGEKPIIWKGCVIQYVETRTLKYHALICKKDGIPWNRRGAYRQYIGMPGTLMIESTRERRDVIVKNISTTGLSFVINTTDIGVEDIGDFRLEFEDNDNHLKIGIDARAVREEEVDEERKVFGASLKKSNIEMNTYIMLKQKQDILKKRRR